MKPTSRTLIFRIGSLGDTVVALPALRLIARSFPDAERFVLTNFNAHAKAAPMADVLRGTGLVHGYIEYPIGLRNPLALARLRDRIRQFNPDVLVYLADPRGYFKTWRDAAFFRSCGTRRLVGVPYSADLQRRRRLAGGLFEYEGARLLRCLGSLGEADLDAPDAFDLVLSDAEYRAAAVALAPLGDRRPVLAISLGAKLQIKDWGDANWIALLMRLYERLPGWGLIALGAAVERERTASLLAAWKGDSLNLCGEMALRESAAALQRASAYIGHDSGPMHLAAAVGVPCVAIFSSHNRPGEWFPYGGAHRPLHPGLSCAACKDRRCADPRESCVSSIPVDDVLAAVCDMIEATSHTKQRATAIAAAGNS